MPKGDTKPALNAALQIGGRALNADPGFGGFGSQRQPAPKPIAAPPQPTAPQAPTVPIGQLLQPGFSPLYPVGGGFNFMNYFQNMFKPPASGLGQVGAGAAQQRGNA